MVSDKEIELHAKIAEMEGDLASVLATFSTLFDALGIDFSKIADGNGDVITTITMLVAKLPMKLASPSFDKSIFSELGSLQPLLAKYDHLVPKKK